MIQLSLEIPTAFLKQWSPLIDLDFVLAHRILEDDVYAAFYASRPTSRRLILDNSMHELGRSLSIPELEEAAKRCRADVVIAPDRLRDPTFCYEQFKATHRALGSEYGIGVVMCGRDEPERASYLSNVRQADVLCLPYREDRASWLHQHLHTIQHRWSWIHLLGVNELLELRRISRQWFNDDEARSLSVDTAKPIKWGLEKRSILDGASLRNAPTSSFDLLNLKSITTEQEKWVFHNIAALRTFLV